MRFGPPKDLMAIPAASQLVASRLQSLLLLPPSGTEDAQSFSTSPREAPPHPKHPRRKPPDLLPRKFGALEMGLSRVA